MIYTLTLNPSLDYFVDIPSLKCGHINRSRSELLLPGGKGVNVSLVLSRLGVQNTAMGFVAGKTGELFCDMLSDFGAGCDFNFVRGGCTRINVKLRSDLETEINGRGPEITDCDIAALISKLSALSQGDTLVISGSVPPSLPDTVYADILSGISHKEINIVADTTGKYLINILKYRPFMVKPNHIELAEISGTVLDNDEKIISAAKNLISRGAENVLVSMGADGAILVCSDGHVIKCGAPEGTAVSTVGAGDSAVAGFIAGYMKSGDLQYALKMAVSAGSATAFTAHLAESDDIMRIFKSVR